MGHLHATATTQTPRRRDAERNRLLVLSAARSVFAQRGLDGSIDEIAREAGVGVGTVYRHFSCRDALIEALFADAEDTVDRIVQECFEMPRAWDGLQQFMVAMLDLQARDKGLRDMAFSRGGKDTAEGRIRDRIKPSIAELVSRAQAEGDLREDLTFADIGVLEVAALGIAEFTALAGTGAIARYLAVMTDGMRQRPQNTPLPEPEISDEDLDRCMAGWKYGTRRAR